MQKVSTTGALLSAARPVEDGSPVLEEVCDRNAGLDCFAASAQNK